MKQINNIERKLKMIKVMISHNEKMISIEEIKLEPDNKKINKFKDNIELYKEQKSLLGK